MKKIIIVVMSIFLIGVVFAGVILSNNNSSISLTSKQKTALDGKGFDMGVAISQVSCDDEWCSFLISKQGVINKREYFRPYYEKCLAYEPDPVDMEVCLEYETTYYTDQELEGVRNDLIEKLYVTVADATIMRNEKGSKVEKVGGGSVTTTGR